MKKVFLYLTAVLFLQTAISCKKENDGGPVTKTIDVELNANQAYQYDLGSFGDEEGASIEQQTSHYADSKIVREKDFVTLTYHYQPANNYTGTDEVVLKSARGSDGASPNDEITITTIKFVIR